MAPGPSTWSGEGRGVTAPGPGLSYPLVATGRSAGRGLPGRHRPWQYPSGLGDLVFVRRPVTSPKINAEQLFSNYVFSLECSKISMDRQQILCGLEDLGARSPELLMRRDPWSWFYRELGQRTLNSSVPDSPEMSLSCKPPFVGADVLSC